MHLSSSVISRMHVLNQRIALHRHSCLYIFVLYYSNPALELWLLEISLNAFQKVPKSFKIAMSLEFSTVSQSCITWNVLILLKDCKRFALAKKLLEPRHKVDKSWPNICNLNNMHFIAFALFCCRHWKLRLLIDYVIFIQKIWKECLLPLYI